MFYPLIDNEIIGFGPIALCWYGLSYLCLLYTSDAADE